MECIELPSFYYKPAQDSLLAQYLCWIRVSILDKRDYASGLKPGCALILNQNPFFLDGSYILYQLFYC